MISCNSNKITENKENLIEDKLNNNSINHRSAVSNEYSIDSTKVTIQSDTLIEFQNAVFEFASNTHLINCKFQFECDCCYGDLIFKSDYTFYYIDHCMSDMTVTRGFYSIQDSLLILNSDSIKVQELYNNENEIDTSAVDYIISDSIIKPYEVKFAIQSCESTIKLIDTKEPEHIAIMTERKSESNIQTFVKKDIMRRFNYLDQKNKK